LVSIASAESSTSDLDIMTAIMDEHPLDWSVPAVSLAHLMFIQLRPGFPRCEVVGKVPLLSKVWESP
jgi:hypothetical protein